jgi:protein O-mannosyl-transferase
MRRAPLKGSRAGTPRSGPTRRWIAPLAAAVLAAVVYASALHNPFVYDDHDTVTANPSLLDLSNVRFLLIYSPFRPVVNVSYALDRFAWGSGPFGFHATNIALHAVATWLFAILLLRLLSDAGLKRWTGAAAFAGASLFALHPLQSEAVGYVSGRSELICAVWFLASLLAARSAMISGRAWHGVVAVGCGAMAIASKETAIVLPVIVIGYDWLLGPGGYVARRRRLLLVLVPACALLMALGVFRLLALGAAPTAGGMRTPVLNLLTQGIVIWRYVGLLLWPQGQSIMHAVHRVVSPADPLALAALAALSVTCVAAFRLRRSHPLVAFGTLWFLAVLAPSSSVIALREGMAEHRVYLASAGLFLIVAAQAGRWLEGRSGTPRVPVRFAALTCAGLAVLAVLTVRRNAVWGSPVSLWTEATVHAAGMWEPYYALGDSRREAGDCAGAVAAYRTVVEMRPSHRDAHTNLGICLAQTGQLEAAERSFRRALEIDPDFARGYTNLGALALIAGDADRARDFYGQALALDNANVLARLQLASLFEHTFKDYRSAARLCGEARLIAPSTPGVAECVERNRQLAGARDAGR